MDFQKQYTDEEIIAGLKSSKEIRDNFVRLLYQRADFQQIVRQNVIKRGGQNSDITEIYQLAIINLVQSILKDKFISGSLKNYFYGIVRNLWHRHLRGQRSAAVQDQVAQVEVDLKDPEIVLIEKERKEIMIELLNRIDEKCRKILSLWANAHSMEEIAAELSYKSAGMARKKKHQCLQRLIELGKKDSTLIRIYQSNE